jgi:predicted MPP superfamily phosphohydrolase
MIHHVVGWLQAERRKKKDQGRWARWIGRNWARFSYGFKVEPTWLELNQFDIGIPDLPPAFAGFRIAQLTDFHCSRQVTPAYLNEAVSLAQQQKPDLIVLTGDFVHKGHRYVDRVAATLGRLSAPLGVFAVLGNHDFSVRNALGLRRYRHLHRRVARALEAQGIRVLRNEAVRIRRGAALFHLAGVEDLWSRSCDLDQALAGLCPSVPCIMLAHNPRTAERLQGRRCDLMLSGHTHGGQVNWPGLGRPFVRGCHTFAPPAWVRRWMRDRGRRRKHAAPVRFAAGLYQFSQTQVYVNKGVGFGFRFRFGVRPEVAVMTLQPAA